MAHRPGFLSLDTNEMTKSDSHARGAR